MITTPPDDLMRTLETLKLIDRESTYEVHYHPEGFMLFEDQPNWIERPLNWPYQNPMQHPIMDHMTTWFQVHRRDGMLWHLPCGVACEPYMDSIKRRPVHSMEGFEIIDVGPETSTWFPGATTLFLLIPQSRMCFETFRTTYRYWLLTQSVPGQRTFDELLDASADCTGCAASDYARMTAMIRETVPPRFNGVIDYDEPDRDMVLTELNKTWPTYISYRLSVRFGVAFRCVLFLARCKYGVLHAPGKTEARRLVMQWEDGSFLS